MQVVLRRSTPMGGKMVSVPRRQPLDLLSAAPKRQDKQAHTRAKGRVS